MFKKFLVCTFNIIFITPFILFLIVGYIAETISDFVKWLTDYKINPLRTKMYGWAYGNCRYCKRLDDCVIYRTKSINYKGCKLIKL